MQQHASTSKHQYLVYYVIHCYVAPCHWWHVSPYFAPLSDPENAETTCHVSTILPRHADIIFHVALSEPIFVHHMSLIETNHIAPHIHLEEREKAHPCLVLQWKSFYILFPCFPNGLTCSVILYCNFAISQNLKFVTLLICQLSTCYMDLRLHATQSEYHIHCHIEIFWNATYIELSIWFNPLITKLVLNLI